MKYIKKADILSATIKFKGKEIEVKNKDFVNGVYQLAKGGDLSEYKYIPKRDVISFNTKNGVLKDTVNGIYVKKSVLENTKQKPVTKTQKPASTGKTNLDVKPSEKFQTKNDDLSKFFEALENAKSAKENKAKKSEINSILNRADIFAKVIEVDYPELVPKLAYGIMWYNSSVPKSFKYSIDFALDDGADNPLVKSILKIFKEIDYQAPKLKKVTDKNPIKSKQTQKLLGDFTGNDDLRPQMLATSLDKGYAVSTNAHIFLAVYDKSLKNKDELVCMTDKCKKVYGTKYPTKIKDDIIYPNWRPIIPNSYNLKSIKINAEKLYQILSKVNRYELYNPTTQAIRFKIGDTVYGFNNTFLLQCLKAMIILGKNDLFIQYGDSNNRAIIITDEKEFNLNFRDSSFALCMPVMLLDSKAPIALNTEGEFID